jgi:predicted amidohydrolase
MDDPIYASLGECARRERVFIAGNAYETDPHFPALYFQTSFVIDWDGALCLRYRRLISMFAPTPHDVLDAYLDRYGWDGVFPVADTAIGKLAAIASEEILYPEIARAMALRGAEVFVHSTSEVGSPTLTPKHIAKRARALENLAYVVSANSAGIEGTAIPAESTDGMSCVVDYRGASLIEAATGESMVANAPVDLQALRAYRRRPGMGNLLSRQRLELFAPTYGGTIHPKNTLADTAPTRAHFLDTQKRVLDDLAARGLI